MPNRTPSIVVVGLVLVTLLLTSFYMSCSSKSTELRQTVEGFEERIRTLTLKNNDNEKRIESLNSRKNELEEEKSDIKRQIEKKESELNELNTKLNEKAAEIKTLQSDKQVLDEQLKDSKNTREILASKNSLIKKLQQDLNEQKEINDEQKQEIDNYKSQIKNQQDKSSVQNPPQRFAPLLSSNETILNSSSLLNQPLEQLKNLTNDIKDKISNLFTNANNSQQINQTESNPKPSENDTAGHGQNNSMIHQRFQRSLNDSQSDIKVSNSSNNTQIVSDNAQIPVNQISTGFLNETVIANNQSQSLLGEKNYRTGNRDGDHQRKNLIE